MFLVLAMLLASMALGQASADAAELQFAEDDVLRLGETCADGTTDLGWPEDQPGRLAICRPDGFVPIASQATCDLARESGVFGQWYEGDPISVCLHGYFVPMLESGCMPATIETTIVDPLTGDGMLVCAQPVLVDLSFCVTATPTVTTASELDDAIHCYNTQTPAGDHVITFGNDIAHPGHTPTVTQTNPDFSLSLQGEGSTLSGPGFVGVLASLIAHDSPARLNIDNLSITNAELTGVSVHQGSAVLSNVTIHDNENGIGSSGGSVLLSNSTVINSVFDVVVGGGSFLLANSYAGDLIVDDGGMATVVSSIVAGGCDIFDGSIVDGGNNFENAPSTCGFTELNPLLLAGVTDNGGLTPTVALPLGSNAVGAGDCTDVPVGFDPAGDVVVGDLEFDQRGPGFPRTINVGCDAGSFEVECVNPFADVPDDFYFTEPVIWAACNGVTTGTAVGPPALFSPTGPVTRADMATFMWRSAGRPAPTGAPHGFTDVPVDSVAIQWLAEQGITNGTGDGTTFSPNETVTRAQMATFLWRLQGEPTAPGHSFTDVPSGVFFDAPVGWLSSVGITTGTGDGTTYSPDVTLIRAEAITFLWRLITLPAQ